MRGRAPLPGTAGAFINRRRVQPRQDRVGVPSHLPAASGLLNRAGLGEAQPMLRGPCLPTGSTPGSDSSRGKVQAPRGCTRE